MRVGIDYGREHLDLEVREGGLVGVHGHTPAAPLADSARAIREALESPIGFPALRRALTPDDHVAVVLDEHLPHLPELLVPVLAHVAQAGVTPGAITVVCAPSLTRRDWVERLPAEFADVRVEVHDPADRRKLSYLATTRRGRRLYLNRTTVDADQVVVLARRGYSPLHGYSGGAGALYPALSDDTTRRELCGLLSLDVPAEKPWPARREAEEVAWLLGAPFFLQVIEGAGDSVAHVIGGLAETSEEGVRLLNARWRIVVDALADTVVAGVGGPPERHTFADLAAALACAARVVKPQGRIVLLSRAEPALGEAAELLRQADEPEEALQLLRQHTPPDMAAAFQWASAARRASIYLLSGVPAEAAEELFTTPLEHAGQVQRLLGAGGSCLLLPDAHKALAVAQSSRQ
jgi:nickel-dependent lactate racemase